MNVRRVIALLGGNCGEYTCIVCGRIFTSVNRRTKICSDDCRNTRLIAYRKKYNEMYGERNNKARLLKFKTDKEYREKRIANHKQWYSKNREKLCEQKRKHYLENREKILQIRKEYYIKKKNKIKDDSKVYSKAKNLNHSLEEWLPH